MPANVLRFSAACLARPSKMPGPIILKKNTWVRTEATFTPAMVGYPTKCCHFSTIISILNKTQNLTVPNRKIFFGFFG